MKISAHVPSGLLWALLLCAPGCMVASQAELDGVQSRNRVLLEQHQAHLAEIENLKVHCRETENQLAAAEEKLALAQSQIDLQQHQLESDQPLVQSGARSSLSPAASHRLAVLAESSPAIRFDQRTGVGRLDTDILFDSGRTDLRPGAREALTGLVDLLRSPDGRDLRVLVVGHTDDRSIAGADIRQQYPDNFSLSTARAKAVADELRRLGLDEQRLGVAGFGAQQPLATNGTAHDRQKNRRVEIFVMVPEAPVVGWTDSQTGLY
jgi:chemotaxis protein MotB